jgi:hypothetical protein
MTGQMEADFARADRAIEKAAAAIAREIDKLLAGHCWSRRGHLIRYDYLINGLLLELLNSDDIEGLMQTLVNDAIPTGPATIRLSNALLDYRDNWRER